LLTLCLIWAAGLLRGDLLPRGRTGIRMSPMELEAALLGVFAVFAAVAGVVRKAPRPRGRVLGAGVLAGAGLFVAPALLTALTRGWIDDATRVALFALVPVFAVVLEPHMHFGEADEGFVPARGGLLAGMAAVVGTLLVFPVATPQTAATGLAFAGVVVCAAAVASGNCVAAAACRQRDVSWLGFATVCAGSAALALGAAELVLQRGDDAAVRLDGWAVPDLMALGLLFWLMPRMGAVRMATRFVIAPLLANLLGLAFLRPGVQWRGWMGLALIAAGSGWLLIAPDAGHDESPVKLGLT
jgi:hypothetical protein